jgi:hypothetical protein
LVVSANSDVNSIVVTDLYRLGFAQRERSCHANSGAGLPCRGIRYTTQAGNAPEPEISVEREPEPWLHIVTQVAFKGADGLLGLNPHRSGYKGVPLQRFVNC